MAKKFLTAKDIDFHADQGVTEIHVDDDLVITDMGQERSRERGVRLVRLAKGEKSPPHPACTESNSESDTAEKVRATVIERLGATPEGLDKIIQQVLSTRGVGRTSQ